MNFLGIEEKYALAESAKTTIIPVPYEASTSYMAGTKNGPQAIISASEFVELYDEEIDKEIFKTGIYTAPQLEFSGDVEKDFQKITEAFSRELDKGKFPVGLGGEHSVSYPIYKAFHQKYDNLSVLQLDAHSDLRETYQDSPYSHACVMKRIYDINKNIVQVGIRSQCIEEAELIKQEKINTHYAFRIKQDGFQENIVKSLKQNVFITIDVDYFDPSLVPSTGTPEPGGFQWDETVNLLKKVFRERNVVGFDVVELSPLKGLIYPDFAMAKLIYKLIGFKFHFSARQE